MKHRIHILVLLTLIFCLQESECLCNFVVVIYILCVIRMNNNHENRTGS